MNCQSCGEARNKLARAKSNLIPSMELNLCSDCKARKLEPRWMVVLAGRSFGAQHIHNVITKRLYIGREIELKELLA
jgi:NMD protein affecting ribosome stability and mRNA decay